MIRKVCLVSYTELLRHMSTIVQDVVNARLPARPPTYLSACLSVGRRSVRLSVCLPVCLSPSSCMSVSLCLLVFNCLIDSLFVRMAVSLFLLLVFLYAQQNILFSLKAIIAQSNEQGLTYSRY